MPYSIHFRLSCGGSGGGSVGDGGGGAAICIREIYFLEACRN